jgi:hypothetical protein
LGVQQEQYQQKIDKMNHQNPPHPPTAAVSASKFARGPSTGSTVSSWSSSSRLSSTKHQPPSQLKSDVCDYWQQEFDRRESSMEDHDHDDGGGRTLNDSNNSTTRQHMSKTKNMGLKKPPCSKNSPSIKSAAGVDLHDTTSILPEPPSGEFHLPSTSTSTQKGGYRSQSKSTFPAQPSSQFHSSSNCNNIASDQLKLSKRQNLDGVVDSCDTIDQEIIDVILAECTAASSNNSTSTRPCEKQAPNQNAEQTLHESESHQQLQQQQQQQQRHHYHQTRPGALLVSGSRLNSSSEDEETAGSRDLWDDTDHPITDADDDGGDTDIRNTDILQHAERTVPQDHSLTSILHQHNSETTT